MKQGWKIIVESRWWNSKIMIALLGLLGASVAPLVTYINNQK